MNEDPTLPPHQPNTPRVWLLRILGWMKANPLATAALAGVLVGLVLPVVLKCLL